MLITDPTPTSFTNLLKEEEKNQCGLVTHDTLQVTRVTRHMTHGRL